jgi:hypothetical protein
LDATELAGECQQRRAIGLPSEFLSHAQLKAYASLEAHLRGQRDPDADLFAFGR